MNSTELSPSKVILQPKRSRLFRITAATDEIRDLPDDLIFKILVSLPAQFVLRLKLVCKKWFHLISSPDFVTCQANQSETLLIAKELTFTPPDQSYYRVFDLDCARDRFAKSGISNMGRILTACDGLVLATTKANTSLILANPLTRKHTELPLGSHRHTAMLTCEIYSLAFCSRTGEYKVVHMYRRENVACEILSVRTREWKMVDSFPPELLTTLWHTMIISVDGTLYWMPVKHGGSFLVCMDVQDERFETKKLPVICAANDRLVEIGGVVGLMIHVTHHVMQVWILDRGEKWIKRYDIDLNFGFGYSPVPVCSRNGNELVFAYPGGNQLYIYDLEKGQIKLAYSRDEVDKWSLEKLCIAHRTTLVSWE